MLTGRVDSSELQHAERMQQPKWHAEGVLDMMSLLQPLQRVRTNGHVIRAWPKHEHVVWQPIGKQ